MVADPPTDRPQLSDRAEIEAAAPHERMDGVEEIATERPVAGDAAGADEGGALPREGTRFIIRDGGVDRERDRSRFGRGAKAEVDAEDITFRIPLLQRLDHPLADTDRRLRRLLAKFHRKSGRIEQQQEVDVRGVVELPATALAERDDRSEAHTSAPQSLMRIEDAA